MLFKKIQMSLITKQVKYGQIKVSNFTIYQESHGFRIIIQKYIQYITKIKIFKINLKEKSVVAEIVIIRTLRNKIYKYMTSKSKNVSIIKLDDTVNKCNNRSHKKIEMQPVDVKSSTYIDFYKKIDNEGPK